MASADRQLWRVFVGYRRCVRSSGVPVDEDLGRRRGRWYGEVDARHVEDATAEPPHEFGVVIREVVEGVRYIALEPHEEEASHRCLLQRPRLPGVAGPRVVRIEPGPPSSHRLGREGAGIFLLAGLDGEHPVPHTHVRLLWIGADPRLAPV